MSLFAACFPDGGINASETRRQLGQALQQINGQPVHVGGDDHAILIAQPSYGTEEQSQPDILDNLVGEFHLTDRDLLAGKLAGNSSSSRKALASAQDGHLACLALDNWGNDAVKHLHGGFAFVYWNQHSRRILLARDRLGSVPLYYFRDQTGFWVSNSLRVLLITVPARVQLNQRRLLIMLMGLRDEDFNSTQYKQFQRLPAAHFLSLAPSSAETPCPRRYWRMGTGSPQAVSTDFENNSDSFRTLLDRAVQDRIPHSGPVGIELSGGLDSSSISGLAAKHCRERIRSCSAVFPGFEESDEKAYIDSAVHHQRITNHQFAAPELDAPAYYEKSLRLYGGLHLGGNIHVAMHIQEQLAEQGCTVILNGIDGDNIASHGLHYLKELAEQKRWKEFCINARGVADIFSYYSDHPEKTFFQNFGRKSLDKQAATGLSPSHFAHLAQIARLTGISYSSLLRRSLSRRMHGFTEADKPASRLLHQEFFNKDLVRAIQDSDSPLPLSRQEPAICERDAQLRALNSGVTEHYFELLHSISSANRIYTRSPFMEPDLIEFCLDVPGEHKLRDGWNRALLRKGLEAELGPKIAWRRWKSDLSPALQPMIDDHCLPEIKDSLSMPNHRLWDFFDRSEVAKYLADTLKHGASKQMNTHRIWSLWAMGRFLHLNLHRKTASAQI